MSSEETVRTRPGLFRRTLRDHWAGIFLFGMLGTLVGIYEVYINFQPMYKAYSVLRAEPPSAALYGVNTSYETFEMFLKTQVQLLTSPNVLTAAGASPQVSNLFRVQSAHDVVQELKKVVDVDVKPGTTLIEVSMTSPDSDESAVIVNAVVKAYLETNEEWADGMTRTQIKRLEEYLRELHNQTDELERRWKEFVARGDVDSRQLANDKRNKDNANTEDASSTRSVTIDQYKKVNNDILEIDMQLAEAQAVLATAKAAAGKINSSSSSPAEEKEQIDQMFLRQAQSDPDILAIAADMEKAEKRLDDALRIVRDESDPSVKRAKNAVDGFKVKYQKLWDSKYANFRTEREQGGSAAMTPEQEVRELSAKVDTLNARRVALNQKKQELNVDNQRQSTDMVDVMLIQDQRASIKLMQEQVQRRLEQLRYESRGETRVRKVSDATASPKPISDKRITYLAITPIGVLGTVLGLIVLLEIRSGRVADPDVLSSRVKHEVFSIAPLPNLKPGEDVNGEKAEQRLARFVQSLDHLRVAICEGGPTGGEGRCVMITSATGGEGKTTLSAHLAARCANSGTSTLLIDADMRRASLGRLLDVPVGAGLGDVLGGDIDLDEALITVQAGGFHFLSAGTPGRDPSRVLKSARLSDLIARLRQTYDLVIIDTPPVLPVADALILGRWADGAVMAARFDASRLPLVERANRQLALAGIPVLGVVVNGVRGQDAAYGNYAYSYNYYPSRSERSNGNPTV